MRILALDVGDVYIGVAVSDPLEITAQALPTIKRTTLEEDLKKVLGFLSSLEVKEIVIGLPRTLKGNASLQTEKVKKFAQALRERVSLPVTFFDERFTTNMALRQLYLGNEKPSRKKGLADKVSAVIILQDYLNSIKLRSPDV
ncbi:MAG: Holliday junction resolvase RuvX [bacterium]